MKNLLFAPEALNLSETTRMIEIARQCRGRFAPFFFCYGGQFARLVEEAGFPLRLLEPTLTPQKEEHLYKIDRMEKRGDFFTVEELQQRVRNEVALFREVAPAAVVTGFCLSTTLSTQVAGVPLVFVLSAASVLPYYQAMLGTWPDAFDYPCLRWLPERWLNWFANVLFTRSSMLTGSINKVAQSHGLRPFPSFLHLPEAGYVLLSDIPEMTNLRNLPPRYHYIGPIISHLEGDVPAEILALPHDLPLVYFAMGSSGNPTIIREILEGFAGRPYRVIAPVLNLIQGLEVRIPGNVLVTGWIPAHKVNPLAAISVIHGGQGTVYTACLSGTPIVGVAMQPEQEGNLECLVRKGFAIRIRKRRLTAQAILDAVDALLANPEARRKAREFQRLCEAWNGPACAARFLEQTFDPRPVVEPPNMMALQ
jgi:UDP:flavonoid glycosyltransferase YjiC (YdhE family)